MKKEVTQKRGQLTERIKQRSKERLRSLTMTSKPGGCVCQRCGERYALDLLVPDELWELIKPKGKTIGAGLLCGKCIIDELESALGYSAFELTIPPTNLPGWGGGYGDEDNKELAEKGKRLF